MKKTRRLLGLFSILFILFNIYPEKLYAKDNILETELNIMINEYPLKYHKKPIVKNGRILVPLRSIFEAMGIEVNWDPAERAVYAWKDDYFVKVVIDSTLTLRNEEIYELDQSAIIYKDSTYVPLRFIGEAFGGEVIWDELSKTATVRTEFTTTPVIREFSQMDIYIDNILTKSNYKPITYNGIEMIPIEPVLKAMGIKKYMDEENNEIVCIKNNDELRINLTSNVVVLNNQYIYPVNIIFDYQGMLYLPLSLLEQAFKARTVWNSSANKVNIFNKELPFVLPVLSKESIEDAVIPQNAPTPVPKGNTRLMVSDNPENLNASSIPGETATLWQDAIKEQEDYVEHIVFGYHKNQFDFPVAVGITIENLSKDNDIEIVNPKGVARYTSRDWGIYDVGLKLAELSITDLLPPVLMKDLVVKAGETKVMDYFYVNTANLVSFQHQFVIKKKSGTGNLNYVIRTVVSKKDEIPLESIKTEPLILDPAQRHPRGSWPFARLERELPLYEAGSSQIAYSISNGITDNIFSAETSFGKEYGTVGNIGHYAVINKIKIPVANYTGSSKTIQIRLNPRGGRYGAVVKTNEGYFRVPEMSSKEVTKIIEYSLEDGQEEILEFEISNAGGSSLPIAINIITLEEENYH
ncbi:MAG TPA: stalk domain-containing protein [Defluviitaleaceae bacterium]|nr:stalk domain-containing protein [Defluviitaleaceae bacterium]HPT76662.1 stalk domain-containing protein [Defluviitaleaceae bacterium]